MWGTLKTVPPQHSLVSDAGTGRQKYNCGHRSSGLLPNVQPTKHRRQLDRRACIDRVGTCWVDDWIERLHFLLGQLAEPVFGLGAKVHLTTVQIRSGLISLSLFPTHASLCFHSCVFTTQECIRRLLIWETGEDLREHPNWSCQWTKYLYNNVVASCQSFSSSFKFDASN